MHSIPFNSFVGEVNQYVHTYLYETALFKENTRELRRKIEFDLQEWLDIVISEVPNLFSAGIAVCNETNNTPKQIDDSELSVDVSLTHWKNDACLTIQHLVSREKSNLIFLPKY